MGSRRIEYWGYQGIIDCLRYTFRGHEMPADACEADIMFHVERYLSIPKHANACLWRPKRVQFVGPGSPGTSGDDVERITVVFSLTGDGRLVIEDVSLG